MGGGGDEAQASQRIAVHVVFARLETQHDANRAQHSRAQEAVQRKYDSWYDFGFYTPSTCLVSWVLHFDANNNVLYLSVELLVGEVQIRRKHQENSGNTAIVRTVVVPHRPARDSPSEHIS